MEMLDRYEIDPEPAWAATLIAGIVAIALAAVAFTRAVYWGFLWRYFWGPVEADAGGESCLIHFPDDGVTVTSASDRAIHGCARAYENAFVAEPGYTVISTVGYILVLVFMLAGVYMLLERFSLEPVRYFFYALVPFMLFGGSLRTVEDAFVSAIRAGETPAIEFPGSALLISPFIYFTVFAIALGAFVLSKWLARADVTDTYYYPLGTAGTVALSASFGYVLLLSIRNDWVDLVPAILVVTVGLATVLSVGTYALVDRIWPEVNEGTGLVGLVIVWGHAIDGVANVLANDWTWYWNLGEYSAKHPLNRTIMDVTNALQGGTEIAGVYVGEAWPFLIVKLVVPIAIVSVFDRQFLEESPRFAIMLLGAIVAVGLGPGTRDMIRVAFGI